MFKHSYSLRVSTVFKNYNFKGVMYIRTQALNTHFSKISHIHKCTQVHTRTVFPMCVVTTQMKTEHFLHANDSLMLFPSHGGID